MWYEVKQDIPVEENTVEDEEGEADEGTSEENITEGEAEGEEGPLSGNSHPVQPDQTIDTQCS